ncbi:hypothetical protein MMC13_004025 [Lambiella insularis]|nr:hypothetical protein [Lambiella insularis]
MKYFPEDEPLIRRNFALQDKIAHQSPSAVKKMSTDEGEMFFLEYWRFADQDGSTEDSAGSLLTRNMARDGLSGGSWSPNSTQVARPKAPLLVHQNGPTVAVSIPQGTSTLASTTATSPSAPLSSSTSTTTSAPPTTSTPPPSTSSLPAPLTCSPGFHSCPPSLGGGCCSTARLCGTGILCPAASPSSSSTSTTSTPPSSPSAATSVGAPLRPTSLASLTTTLTSALCPTGFYQCSAYYNGGACCQVGRDCGLTSCPPHASATALASDGVTVVDAPTAGVVVATATNEAAAQGGACATGWFLCGGQAAGCCPSGYACGEGECLAGTGPAATATTGGGGGAVEGGSGRVSARGGSGGWGWMGMGVGVGVGVLLVL